jgi:integrase
LEASSVLGISHRHHGGSKDHVNFEQQAQVFLASRTARNRNPVKPSTLTSYRSRLDNHILPAIGSRDLESFGNGAMKEFARGLSEKGLGAKTILETVVLVKQVVASAVSPDGDYLYPRQWNHDFIDLPPLTGQKQPIVTQEQLKAALADKRYGLFYAFLAGTGLRIGEALALRYGSVSPRTAWIPGSAVVHVRSSIWRNLEGAPKTPAAVRQIDLHPDLNVRLQEHVRDLGLSPTDENFVFHGSNGCTRLCESTIRKESLKPLGIEGFHTFRRFRATYMREQGVPEDLLRYWMGHAGVGVTDRYSKMFENLSLRKTWAEKAGVGFDLRRVNG